MLVHLLLSASLLLSVSSKELELRNLGLAQLEDEKPAEAEATYAKLAKILPDDPLPAANMAIAALRQQKHEEALQAIDRALVLAPDRPDLLAIRAAALTWSGSQDRALEDLLLAANQAPSNPEIQYALYRQAGTVGGEQGEQAAAEALTRLTRLRPENVVVLLQLGSRSIAEKRRDVATHAYLRLQELSWQAPAAATKVLDGILKSLEADDLESARIPALRLENVFKITAMYQQSLRELNTGILGIPVDRLQGEPPPSGFGASVSVRFQGSNLDSKAADGILAADLDGDAKTDIAWLSGDGEERRASFRLSGGNNPASLPASDLERLLAIDLDNDGRLDVLGYGESASSFWQNLEAGGFEDATAKFGLEAARGSRAVAIDFDIEGDLDLVIAGSSIELWRNALDGPLTEVGSKVFPASPEGQDYASVFSSDFDRDGDLDLLFTGKQGLKILDNLRQGKFETVEDSGVATGILEDLVSVDLDDDGLPDLATVGPKGLQVWKNLGGRYQAWPAPLPEPADQGSWKRVVALDADNDGRLDLALGGDSGIAILQRQAEGFRSIEVSDGPGQVTDMVAADLDHDGDLDLVSTGGEGLHLLDNEGGNANHWIDLRLRGLDKGSSKNNVFGIGSTVEVRHGMAYQFREADSDVVHLGLGEHAKADVVRIVWTNGVPQNRIALAGNQTVVEEQLLKGSCPFVYAWNGSGFSFVTDLLWGAPIGMPVAAGIWAGSDPSELVRLDGLVANADRYNLRLTEELWEAAYFDRVRLWVVDHPEHAEVASNLRILIEPLPTDEILTSVDLRAPVAAWDGRGDDVTRSIATRDDVYADGFDKSSYQGVAQEDWTFTFDLGEAPAKPIRLHLDGWIFPADASLNLAIDQRSDRVPTATRLEVETATGWVPLLDPMGFPAGKTKTMVIDTPALPEGSRRLRIVTQRWLSWDRIAWTVAPADELSRVRARLEPARAEMRYRGFSAMSRKAPNAPHHFDYASVTSESPWLAFPGRYTRYGDVRELLIKSDDQLAILAPGDEIALEFDAAELPPVEPGWQRALFLESVGWDKDADRNTWAAERMEPLPFHGMGGYPYPEGVSYPDTEELRLYRERWLTREVVDSSRPGTSR